MLVLTFQVLVYVIFGTIVFILLPAIIFRFVEAEWTYLDSVYFAFITLTTIGFGDMVAGNLFPFYPRHCSTYYIDCLYKQSLVLHNFTIILFLCILHAYRLSSARR